MRKFTAILLLTSYATIMVHPIFPLLEYAMNKNYIANVLCINRDKPELHCKGKCYRQSQLEKTAEGRDEQTVIETAVQQPFTAIESQASQSLNVALRGSYTVLHNPQYPGKLTFPDVPYPPPRIA